MEVVVGRVKMEHIDHVVDINLVVTDGNSIYFARVEDSPGNQMPQMATPIYSNPRHPVSDAREVGDIIIQISAM